VKVLTLTPQGERMRAAMRERLLAPPNWMMELSRDDQRALRDSLRRASQALRTANEGGTER
jgi:hypothetical protein